MLVMNVWTNRRYCDDWLSHKGGVNPRQLYSLIMNIVSTIVLFSQVIRRKAWREIAKALDLPASITSAAFTLRTQ